MARKTSFSNRYCVRPGKEIKLSQWDANETGKFKSKDAVKEILKSNLKKLSELQYLLYAESKHAVLIVLQAMDAGGKDGTVRHVMGPLNPASCKVSSFKVPTDEELAHDFLWRIHQHVPRKGEIGIFNRSHYEDVLIVRVKKIVPKSVWSKRYRQINDFEQMLAENNVHILKFYLHISKSEQLERLKARIDDPIKHWKINPNDFVERKYWSNYMKAFEDALNQCSTSYAPWFVIPANHKWYRNLVVSEILIEQLQKLKMKFPEPYCDISSIEVK